MAKIKKNDFVEITYTGTIDGDKIFDTTNEALAKDQDIYNENMSYGPVIVCVGKNQIVAGLDNSLVGKEANNEYEVDIKPEEAFGKKDSKMIQLISTAKFRKENIDPQIGMQVNIDGIFGIIKTVSGGRTLVDFNHPLSGKDVHYSVKIHKIIDDVSQKIASYVKIKLNMSDVKVEVKENTAAITVPEEIPKEAQDLIRNELKDTIKEVSKYIFTVKKEKEIENK